MQCLGLIAEKPTLQKTCRSEQNSFDCSGARTPDVRCTIGTMYHWAIKADQVKEMMEYIPHVARYIPTHTYIYLCIHAHIREYLHIHAHTCTYPTPPTWNGHISATSEPFDQSQRTALTTVRFWQIVLVCGTWSAFATIWRHSKNWSGGSTWEHQNTQNVRLFSARAGASCTMRVGGRVIQVWACLDDPGRFYDGCKMDQVTKVVEGGVFDALSRQKEISDFSTHKRVLYYAGGRAIGQSFGLSRASGRILWPWQDRSQHRFLKEKSKNRVGGGGWDGVKKWSGTCPGVPWVGPPGCWVTRRCFGDAVVVSVPQWSNACNRCRYWLHTDAYMHIHTDTYRLPIYRYIQAATKYLLR
jgi:hypothetical protein